MARLLATLLCLTLLTACGYSLRGSSDLESEIDAIALVMLQPNGELARLLRRSLERAEVGIVEAQIGQEETARIDTAGGDIPVLRVGAERIISRPVSVNPRARAAQYEIRLSVELELERGEETLIPRETLLVERTYLEDIENIAGTQEEVEILTAEMRRELVNQLMRRLESAISS